MCVITHMFRYFDEYVKRKVTFFFSPNKTTLICIHINFAYNFSPRRNY